MSEIHWDYCHRGWRVGHWYDQDNHEYQSFGEDWMYRNGVEVISKDAELKDKWIIWCPESHLPPKVTFDSEEGAAKIAQLMAQKNPGNRFCVCKVAGVAQLVTVKYTSFTEGKRKSL